MKKTHQMDTWSGDFGKNYTMRNTLTAEQVDEEYINRFNVSRTLMNTRFIGGLDRQMKILEVGCNVGLQLEILSAMGFDNLYGIDLQGGAICKIYEKNLDVKAIAATVFDIPFKDDYFDMVFTSGVLIHINPDDLPEAMREIYRCTQRYIWGLEYYADSFEERSYRNENNILWRGNYAKLWQTQCPELELLKMEFFKYNNRSDVDSMYLLERK